MIGTLWGPLGFETLSAFPRFSLEKGFSLPALLFAPKRRFSSSQSGKGEPAGKPRCSLRGAESCPPRTHSAGHAALLQGLRPPPWRTDCRLNPGSWALP